MVGVHLPPHLGPRAYHAHPVRPPSWPVVTRSVDSAFLSDREGTNGTVMGTHALTYGITCVMYGILPSN
jgi:hypothetical protein